jgi:NAD-dependent DNA ligase
MRKKLIRLSWEILEHRYRYYILGESIISDFQYDQLEIEYKNLCEKLEVPAYACDMIGYDLTRPSAQLVAARFEK